MAMPDNNPVYPTTVAASNPLEQAAKVVQLHNLMNNVNKMRGGMPATQDALEQLGAGQPYTNTTGE